MFAAPPCLLSLYLGSSCGGHLDPHSRPQGSLPTSTDACVENITGDGDSMFGACILFIFFIILLRVTITPVAEFYFFDSIQLGLA